MTLEELQETLPFVGWQDKATGSEASVCLEPWVLCVETCMVGVWKHPFRESISPLFPSSQQHSILKASVMRCSEKGAWNIMFLAIPPISSDSPPLCDHVNPDFCPGHTCGEMLVSSPASRAHGSLVNQPTFLLGTLYSVIPNKRGWPHRAAPD